MQCKCCGVNLVRGFTFCLECGSPVPPEMLEESGLPLRNVDGAGAQAHEIPDAVPTEERHEEFSGDIQPQLQGLSEETSGEDLKPQYQGGDLNVGGKDLKPQLVGLGDEVAGEALKAQYIGGVDEVGEGEGVSANVFHSSVGDDSIEEKLVFCPNCGMHMQHDPIKCEKCGMTLRELPSSPSTSNGIPLFNQDDDLFGSGLGGVGEISGEDAALIENFEKGGLGGIPEMSGVDVDFERQLNGLSSEIASAPETESENLNAFSLYDTEPLEDVHPLVEEHTADMNAYVSENKGSEFVGPPPVAPQSVASASVSLDKEQTDRLSASKLPEKSSKKKIAMIIAAVAVVAVAAVVGFILGYNGSR